MTYAVQDNVGHDEVAGPGAGIVDTYDFNGNLIGRLITGGDLNAPWGLAVAPATFGDLSNDLLVWGNFGDGHINAYDAGGNFKGAVSDASGPIAIDGLWGLTFGNGGSGGDANTLYFAAGPDEESAGLFGALAVSAVPEPASLAMLGAGAAMLLATRRRSRS